VARAALITGISGQDGSFLADLLLEKGYEVTGMLHAGSGGALGCSEHLRGEIHTVEGELLAPETLRAAVERVRPDEIYHLAGPSFVPASWERPGDTSTAIVGSCAALLEAVRGAAAGTRLFIASSGAIFGDAPESPQREDTPCRPTNPYAVAKLAAHHLVGALRAHDGLHASSGITFNHESERRPERFVTRRITRGAASIALGLASELTLGSLEAVRDWSFAGDVMNGAWLMLQQEQPDDYVLASGVGHTVADFARAAFACLDLDAERFLSIDESLKRAPEQTPSVGDPARARAKLGWVPAVGFEALVQRMVAADMAALSPYTGAR
jgi:GDPmannose 4,6-dehydratase